MTIHKAKWLLVGLVCLALWPALALAATTPSEIRRVVHEILADAKFQRELPRENGQPSPSMSARGERSTQERPSEREEEAGGSDNQNTGAPGGLGGVGTFLLWVLVVAGGALLVFSVLNKLRLFSKPARGVRDRGTNAKPDFVDQASGGPGEGGLLEKADRLAGQGNYGEAIHVILLHSLEDLHTRLDLALRPSLTSREIMRSVSLTESAKSALTLIVTAAEVSHFGGRTASKAEYRSCRENHQRIASETGGVS